MRQQPHKTLEYRFGSYWLSVFYFDTYTTAEICDYSQRIPLLWSRQLSKEQANGCIQLFNQIGYFDMPVDNNTMIFELMED